MQRIIGFVGLCALVLSATLHAQPAQAQMAQAQTARAWGFEDVAALAEKQARKAYQPANRKPPAELAALTYDQYRDIRFSPDHALWRPEKLPFELMFFHIGKFQVDPVRINEVTPKGVRHIAYDSADFNYGQNKLSPKSWGDLGF